MAGVRPAPRRQGANADASAEKVAVKTLTCAQRIEEQLNRTSQIVKRREVFISETKSLDAAALFRKYDSEETQLLSRGALTELLKEIGLDKAMGESFSASAQLAFDAHSADSHFLSLSEFKQLYYQIQERKPTLLPRATRLNITIICAKGLPPADTNGKADPFCIVYVKDKLWSRSSTQIKEKTLDPSWCEDFNDKYGYEDGDCLVFEIHDFDKGSKSELLCKAFLPSSEFHRAGGFDGNLPLEGAAKGYSPVLKLRVTVAGFPVPPPRLRVKIHSCKGLPPADPNGKSDPFCSVMLVGKPFSRSSTKVVTKSLDPVWEEEFSGKYRYEDGDNLIFDVRDYDGKNAKPELLGKVILENSRFHKKGGFVGEVQLADVPKGIRPPDNGAKLYTPMLKISVFIRDFDPEDEPPPEEVELAGEAAAAAASALGAVQPAL